MESLLANYPWEWSLAWSAVDILRVTPCRKPIFPFPSAINCLRGGTFYPHSLLRVGIFFFLIWTSADLVLAVRVITSFIFINPVVSGKLFSWSHLPFVTATIPPPPLLHGTLGTEKLEVDKRISFKAKH